MSKLEEYYEHAPKYGQNANARQAQELKDMEMSLIREELLPELSKEAERILKEVKSPMAVVLNYEPGKGVRAGVVDFALTAPTATAISMVEEPTPVIPFKETLICIKDLNWSFFEHGTVIPQDDVDKLFAFIGERLERGCPYFLVRVEYKGVKYCAHIDNPDRRGSDKEVVRLIWEKDSVLGKVLKKDYSVVYKYIKDVRDAAHNPHVYVTLPNNLKYNAYLKTTPEANVIKIEIKPIEE